MKKRYIVGIGLVFITGMICLNFLGPYNVLTALTAHNLAKYEEVQQQVEGKILEIQYIGNNIYRVMTEKKDYFLVDNSDYYYRKYKIFELKGEVEIFKNPM